MKMKLLFTGLMIMVMLMGCSSNQETIGFRNTTWGMDQEQVKQSEWTDAELIEKATNFRLASVVPSSSEMYFTSELFNTPVIIEYTFRKEKLVSAQYFADDSYYSYSEDDLVRFAEKIKDEITSKYGTPKTNDGDNSNLSWDAGNTSIVMWDGSKGMGYVKLFYTSEEYLDEVNKDKEKSDSDKL